MDKTVEITSIVSAMASIFAYHLGANAMLFKYSRDDAIDIADNIVERDCKLASQEIYAVYLKLRSALIEYAMNVGSDEEEDEAS